MTSRRLFRATSARPTTRLLLVVAALMGGWYAWSPGTSFGLDGVLGGWRHAAVHLLDAGLVPIVVAAALVGSSLRERRVDDALRTAGLDRSAIVAGAVGAGALVAAAVTLAFAGGSAAGGVLRALPHQGSWWADPGTLAPVTRGLVGDVRVVGATLVLGALAALVGWTCRRDDVAVVVALVLAIPFVEQASPVILRVPGLVGATSATPVGTIRAVALANRGLSAPGSEIQAAVLPFAAAAVAWVVVLVILALPGPRRSTKPPLEPPDGERRSRRPTASPLAVGAVVGLLVVTVTFGALVPPSIARGLPWRWQRSWRDAHRAGWASDQVVDMVLAEMRDDGVVDPDLLVSGHPISPAVTDSVRRATRTVRQPVVSMRGPDLVEVRLEFDQPIESGITAFTAYGLRATMAVGADGRWRVSAVEGPVGVEATASGGAR